MRFCLCISLVFLVVSCGDSGSSSGSSTQGNQLPEVDFQIETVGPIIKGGNSNDVVTFSGGDVTVNLSVNNPYSLSNNQLIFADSPIGSSQQSVTILHNASAVRDEVIK